MQKHARTLTQQACFSTVYTCLGTLSGGHYTAFYSLGKCPVAQLHPAVRSTLACPFLQPKGKILALFLRGVLSRDKAVLFMCVQCVMPLTRRQCAAGQGVRLESDCHMP